MANNVLLNAGCGGATLATDCISCVQYQIGKISVGPLDTATPVHAAGGAETNAIRVTLADGGPFQDVFGTGSVICGSTVQISGGGTSMVDDAAFTVATTQGTPMFALADDACPDSVNEGDAGAVRMSTARILYSALKSDNDTALDVAEDAAIGNAQYGIVTMVQRDDVLTANALVSGDLDATFLRVDNRGALWTTPTDGAGTAFPVGGGTEAAAQRVTIANDSTGVVTIDGTVTADAGTNLNTSALLTTTAHDAAFGTAGSADAQVRSVQGIASGTALGVSVASAGIASGAVASGAIASGAVASGAYASGSIGCGAIASGAIASGAIASGAIASGAVASGAIASGAVASGAIASGAVASGAYASGSIAATAVNVGSALQTNQIMCGTTSLTPEFAIIDAATSGNNTLLAAVSCKKIRVLSAFLVSTGAVNARFESAADGTALTGQMELTCSSGFTLPFSPVGWFETAACALLNLELSGAVSVDGAFVYVSI